MTVAVFGGALICLFITARRLDTLDRALVEAGKIPLGLGERLWTFLSVAVVYALVAGAIVCLVPRIRRRSSAEPPPPRP